MNLQKTGKFLKSLRKDKGLTQEQLAELFCVSPRTVSRWENGNNMPDPDILIGLAGFAAEYMNTGTEKYSERVHLLLPAGAILLFAAGLISRKALNKAMSEQSGMAFALCNYIFLNAFPVCLSCSLKSLTFSKC